jgi:hypothetical protein
MAAGLVLAALGGWVARDVVGTPPPPGTPPPVAEPAGREYLLLLTEPDGLDIDRPLTELVAEYRGWAGELAAEDRMVTGRRLEHGARRLAPGSEPPASGIAGSPAPPAVATVAPADAATGFFLVRATSLDEAVDLAAGCPHLRYGGRITVSEVARDAE